LGSADDKIEAIDCLFIDLLIMIDLLITTSLGSYKSH